MSTKLTTARQKINQIRTHLKQGKVIPAAQNLKDALVTVIKNPLMKQEKEEFAQLLTDAFFYMNGNPELRRVFPLDLTYDPANPKAGLQLLNQLLEALNEEMTQGAKAAMAALEEKKSKSLEEGKRMIDSRQYEGAKLHFDKAVIEFHDDPEYKAEVGEAFLKAERYEEAYEYMAQALKDSPESIHLYNRVGMILRKMGKFEVAEKYYAKALSISDSDPNLYFNLGRLYIDWRQWAKVEKAAARALALDPSFKQAEQMMNFALKKQA